MCMLVSQCILEQFHRRTTRGLRGSRRTNITTNSKSVYRNLFISDQKHTLVLQGHKHRTSYSTCQAYPNLGIDLLWKRISHEYPDRLAYWNSSRNRVSCIHDNRLWPLTIVGDWNPQNYFALRIQNINQKRPLNEESIKFLLFCWSFAILNIPLQSGPDPGRESCA